MPIDLWWLFLINIFLVASVCFWWSLFVRNVRCCRDLAHKMGGSLCVFVRADKPLQFWMHDLWKIYHRSLEFCCHLYLRNSENNNKKKTQFNNNNTRYSSKDTKTNATEKNHKLLNIFKDVFVNIIPLISWELKISKFLNF